MVSEVMLRLIFLLYVVVICYWYCLVIFLDVLKDMVLDDFWCVVL